MAIDGRPTTSWVTDDGVTTAALELNLGGEQECRKVLIQENIALGQRLKRFSLARWTGQPREPVFRQTTIGCKRIVRFPTVRTSKLRLTIDEAKAAPVISNLEIY
jgi:alpha-L-fucosidase